MAHMFTKDTKYSDIDGPKTPGKLLLEIFTPDCADGECYSYDLPEGTFWDDIQRAVNLFYPEATGVSISYPEE